MNTIVKPPVNSPNKAPEKAPEPGGHGRSAARSMFDPAIVVPAIADSFRKLAPRTQLRNPVMFCVYVGSILTTILWFAALAGQAEAPAGFILAISLWLWFTVLFANFAEALAEGRSKAQAASLRSAKRDVMAKKLLAKIPDERLDSEERHLKARLAHMPEATILELIYQQAAYETQAKDYEFSAASMREHWHSGYLDTQRTLRHRDWLTVAESDNGLSVHDIHRVDD